jgi:hypothetical protein
MKQMKQISPQKTPTFFCESCDFISANKKDYAKHLATAKHKNETNETNLTPLGKLKCSHCSISFNSRTTLWRHKKKCGIETSELLNPLTVNKDLNVFVCKILVELNEAQKQVAESQKQVVELLKEKNMQVATNNSNNTTNNTTNNTKININMFLNENCKNAITMNEFIKSIQPTLEDVLYMSKHGNKQGISRILTTALGQLEVTERPMHCTDLKRHTTYIKESDGWTKEHDNSHIDKMCKTAQHGCLLKIGETLKTDANYSTKGTPEYENQVVMINEAVKETDNGFMTTVLENKVYLSKDKIRKG